jgi:hypothetical protein
MRPNHLLPTLALALLLCCFAKLAAQPGWSPPPTPCDTLRPINLSIWTDTVHVSHLISRLTVKLDTALGMMPGLEKLWGTALRAMVLDSNRMRCPDHFSVDLPEVTHAKLFIYTEGFSLRATSHQLGLLRSHRYISLQWHQDAAQAIWKEEILDHNAPAIIRRSSDDGSGIATSVLKIDSGRIVEIARYRDDLRVGLQYLYRKGKDVFSYAEPGSHTARKLYLDRPEDQAIWQREGKAFYDEAFNFYFRLPAPLLEFAPPAERKTRYQSPFRD